MMFNEPAELFTVVCFSRLFYQVIDFKVQLLDHTASWPPGLPEETSWFGFEDSSWGWFHIFMEFGEDSHFDSYFSVGVETTN